MPGSATWPASLAALATTLTVTRSASPIEEPEPARMSPRRSEPLPASFATRYAPIAEGGGFSTTFDIASDGSFMVSDTDVHNGYIRKRGEGAWRKLLRQDNLPRELFDPEPPEARYSDCTWSTTIGPDNRTILTAWRGLLLRSDDAGETFTRAVLPPKNFFGALGHARRFGRSIAAHRVGWLVGTSADGCYFSPDGFRKEFVSLDLPRPRDDYQDNPGRYLVAWSSRGEPFVHVQGTGLFHAPGGVGGQFLFLGGPAWASRLVVDSEDTLYVCHYRNSRVEVDDALWRYRRSQWSQVGNSRNAYTLAIDPFDPEHMVMANENGGWAHSYDGGRSITWFDAHLRGEGESQWLSNISKRNFPSSIAFDPVVRGKGYMTEGVGVCTFAAPEPGAKTITFHDINAGNYELLATCGLSMPGIETVILGVMDKGAQLVEGESFAGWSYCPPHGSAQNNSAVAHLRALDFASDDPAFVVGLFHRDGGNGVSHNAGKTWRSIAPPPGKSRWLPGGDVAVSTRGNFVIVEANRGGVWFTKDGGVTFAPCDFDGDGTQESGEVNASYVQRDCVTADKTRPGTFAMLRNNEFENGRHPDGRWVQNPDAGVWLNQNGGEGPWEHVLEGIVDEAPGKAHTGQFWQAKLSYVDGRPGELLYAALAAHARPANNLVWLKNDGAGEVIDLPATNLRGFDTGKPAPGSDYPSLWFWGDYEGVTGWYVTFDWFASKPILIGRWPVDTITTASQGMVADKNRYRCYLGLDGNGWVVASSP